MAKSFDVLKIKKFDLEFSVDPLFKKTKEDFDEGGAMGLLLNHLGVDGKGRLVFDAGDATLGDEQDDMDPADEDMVDLGPLRGELSLSDRGSQLQGYKAERDAEYIPSTKRLQAMHISDTLLKFKFSSDASDMPDFSTLLGLKDTFDNDAASTAYGGGAGGGDLSMVQEEQDFFGGEDFDTGAPMGGGFDDYPGAGADDDGDNEGEGGAFSHMATAGPGEHMPLDGRKHGGDLVFGLLDADDSAGMFDYFDKGFGKNWAGAEHYKLRRVARKGEPHPPLRVLVYGTVADFSVYRSDSTHRAKGAQSGQSAIHDRLQCPSTVVQDPLCLVVQGLHHIAKENQAQPRKTRRMALTGRHAFQQSTAHPTVPQTKVHCEYQSCLPPQ